MLLDGQHEGSSEVRIGTVSQMVEFVCQIILCEGLEAIHIGRQIELEKEIVIARIESELSTNSGHETNIELS